MMIKPSYAELNQFVGELLTLLERAIHRVRSHDDGLYDDDFLDMAQAAIEKIKRYY